MDHIANPTATRGTVKISYGQAGQKRQWAKFNSLTHSRVRNWLSQPIRISRSQLHNVPVSPLCSGSGKRCQTASSRPGADPQKHCCLQLHRRYLRRVLCWTICVTSKPACFDPYAAPITLMAMVTSYSEQVSLHALHAANLIQDRDLVCELSHPAAGNKGRTLGAEERFRSARSPQGQAPRPR